MYTLDFAAWLDVQLTQRGPGAPDELAAACGVSAATVSRWRTGTNRPDAGRWHLIETALEVPAGTVQQLLLRPRRAAGHFERLVEAAERIADALERMRDR